MLDTDKQTVHCNRSVEDLLCVMTESHRTKEIFEAVTAKDAVLLNDLLENSSISERGSVLASGQCDSDEFPYLDSPLITAVQNGDLESVKVLLKYKANIEVLGSYLTEPWFVSAYTPLFLAAVNGNNDILRCLVENGADVNTCTEQYYTPLMAAIKKGHMGVVTFLTEHGANVNLQDNCGYTALHYACTMSSKYSQVNAVTFLTEHGAKLDIQDEDGKTALHHAVCSSDGSCEILSCLIENGADVNARTNHNTTSLMIAIEKGHISVFNFLIEHGANVAIKEYCGLTAFHYACIHHSSVTVLRCLVEHGADVNARTALDDTPLMKACEQGQVNVVRFLLEHGAEVDLEDTVGATALHNAVLSSDSSCEVLGCLIKNGADVNACPESGFTPLMKASALGNVNAMTFLIEHGANVDKKYKDGETALHLAVQVCGESCEVLNCLIQNKADVNAQANDGHTPLMKAVELSQVTKATFLIEHGAKMDLQDNNGRTALHYAVCTDSLETVNRLFTLGASYVCNKQGLTPLLLASNAGNSEVMEDLIKRPEITKEQRIDALELLGATVVTLLGHSEGLKYIKRGMEERFAHPSQPLLKRPMEPVAAYLNRKEAQTPEELAQIEDNFDAMVMESLKIRERIIGKENTELLFQIRYVASYYGDKGDWSTCVELHRYAIKIAQSSNESASRDLASLSDVFYEMFQRSDGPNKNNVLYLLEQTVNEYDYQRRRETDDDRLEYAFLFYCSVRLVFFITKFQFCEENKMSCTVSTLLRKLCRYNPRDNKGNTLLHEVAKMSMGDSFSYMDAAKLLLKAELNVNAVSNNGDTPLHIAVTLEPCEDKIHLLTDMIKVLFAGGAHHDFVNNDSKTPMDMAQTDDARMILSERRKLELKCVSARAVKKFGIPYFGVVPKTVEKYISMH